MLFFFRALAQIFAEVVDIPLLVLHFCQLAGKGTIFTPEAMALLCCYHWPGNVRELENVVIKVITFCGKRIFPEDVSRHLRLSEHQGGEPLSESEGDDDRAGLILIVSRATLHGRLLPKLSGSPC